MKNKLTIIYYHEVVKNGEGFSYQKIDMEKFEKQMQYLHDHGYISLKFSELAGEIPQKAVIVSFDDGFRTVYENAAPIMKKYGIKGNVYLPTAYIGEKPQFMDWEMVKALDGDFEFQAHTHNHVDIRTLTLEKMKEELATANGILKEKLGYESTAFCMPFGTYDKKSIKNLKTTGKYRYLLGSYYGTVKGKLTGRVLPRIGISNDDGLELFEKKLKGKRNYKGILQRLRLFLHNVKKDRVTEYIYD